METRPADCPLGAKCEEVRDVEGRQVMYRCPWFTQLRGKNPQTGEPVDDWGCAVAWLPVLMIENTKESIGMSSSIDSFRNEMVRNQGHVFEAINPPKKQELLE